MWIAVIIFVYLSVEILSYLTGEQTKPGSSERRTA